MANPTAANTVAGKPLVTGGVLSAVTGTTLPTDAVTALAGAFAAHGYITDDGLTNSQSRETQDVKDWGGVTLVKLQTGFGDEFKFGFLEVLNEGVHVAIYGDAQVTATSATAGHGNQLAVSVGNIEAPHLSWVFEILHGDKKIRLVVPDGQITELDDIEYKSDDLVARMVTLCAYPDASGNTHYEYTDDDITLQTPAISTVLPAGQSIADQVTITGSYFTGASAVSIDAISAQFTLINSQMIIATIPPAAAGAANVTVTNSVGTSGAYSYTVV